MTENFPQLLQNKDLDRLKRYQDNLDFYSGTQWATSSRRERRLTFNYAKVFIDKATSYLMSGINYELMEIPKSLLEEAQYGIYEIMKNSKQTPKPGYCRVYDSERLKFALYFDGGTERKLQIKHIDREFCIFHANWSFTGIAEVITMES